MAGKTLIGGTEYTIKGGKTLIGGTGYSISKGKTLIGGTSQNITFQTQLPSGTTAYFPFTSNFVDVVNGATGTSLVGSPTISSSSGVFGDGALYLNGSSALTIPYSSYLDLTSVGTIEFWIDIISYPPTNKGCTMYGNPIRSGTFSSGWTLTIANNTALYGRLAFPYGNGSSEVLGENSNFGADTLPSLSSWHHVSINRNGSTLSYYLDGAFVSSITVSNLTLGTTAFLMGKSRDMTYYTSYYMNDLLVVQGNVLRTSDFTPPTEHYAY